ncbi:MAG: RNA polymerase sigma factor [Euzebya sp.]
MGWSIRSAARLLRAEAETDQSPLDQTAGHMDLMAALRTLPPRDRQLLVMRYYLGYSTAETAQALRLPTGTVRSPRTVNPPQPSSSRSISDQSSSTSSRVVGPDGQWWRSL